MCSSYWARAASLRTLALPLLGATLCACALGPDYQVPAVPVSASYKELKGWKVAAPHDHVNRGAWWSLYHDPALDALERQIDVSNQTIAAAEAAFRQAAALVQEARAALFPTVNLVYNPTRLYEGPGAAGNGTRSSLTRVTLETAATWNLDVWGKVRRMVESNIDLAQASAADLANARLLAQAQLAVAYFNLRAADSLRVLLDRTIADYKRTETITENQYEQGTVARSDVITAQTQVKTVEAQAINVDLPRAQFEHAIAVLIGRPPAELNIEKTKLGTKVPLVPPGIPSLLLERRPDIATAERIVAAQNALVGVAVTAYFPDISLSAQYGWLGPQLYPVTVANEMWQIAGSATETVIDGGARRAQVAGAEAAFYQQVATYRQTVIAAFQQVEDQLSNLRILARQQRVQDEAVALSRRAVEITLNEYRAGTVAFTTVVTAQATLLANEQAALTVRQNRYLASVNLIQALGGGWDISNLPSDEALRHRRSCVDVGEAIRGPISPEMPSCL
jgi:NodT family efflux transporter outer membrane factor (OMF) lipoprotein